MTVLYMYCDVKVKCQQCVKNAKICQIEVKKSLESESKVRENDLRINRNEYKIRVAMFAFGAVPEE